MKIVFPLFTCLTGKKILFPRVHIRNFSPPGRDLGAVHMKIVFSLFFTLPRKRYFPAFIYEIFPRLGEIYFGGLLGAKILREANIQNG